MNRNSRLFTAAALIFLFIFTITLPAAAQTPEEIQKLDLEGRQLEKEGKLDEALAKYNEAFEMCKKIQHFQGAGIFCKRMGKVYVKQGKISKGLTYLKTSLKVAVKLQDKKSQELRLEEIGDVYMKAGAFKEAVEYYEQALKLSIELKDKKAEGRCRRHVADGLLALGQSQKALEHLEKALIIARKSGNENLVGVLYIFTGNAYVNLSKYEEALKYYKLAEEIAKKQKNRPLLVNAVISRGNAYNYMGRLTETLDSYKRAQDLIINSKDGEIEKRAVAVLKGNIGTVFMKMGNYKKAHLNFQIAYFLAREMGNLQVAADNLTNMGLANCNNLKYRKGLAYLYQARKMHKNMGSILGETTTLNTIGRVFSDLGDYDRALKAYEEALKLSEVSGSRKDRLISLAGLAGIDVAKENYNEALQKYMQAYKIAVETKSVDNKNRIIGNIGIIYGLLNRDNEALGFFRESFEMCREQEDGKTAALCILNLSLTYYKMGEYKKALEGYRNIISLFEKWNEKQGLFIAHTGIGNCYYKLKDRKKAIEHYKKAIGIIETIREDIGLKELRTTFLSRYVDVYKHLIRMLTEDGEVEDAFDFNERARARQFLDIIGSRRINPKTVSTKELIDEETKIYGEINSLKNRMDQDPNSEDIKEKEKLLLALIRKHRGVLDRLIVSDREFAALRTVTTAKMEEVQKALSPDEVIVEYMILSDVTCIWTIDREKVSLKVLNISSRDVRREVMLTRNAIRENTDVAELKKQLARTREKIFSPVEDKVKGKKTLIIIPNGSLHYLPFGALIGSDGKYLVENYSILMEPSASSFVLFRSREKKRPNKLTAFGLGNLKIDLNEKEKNENKEGPRLTYTGFLPKRLRKGFSPLPGTKEESEKINKAFEERNIQSNLFVEKDFTLSAVEKNAPTSGFLHFATHGVLSDKADGRFSGLVTADDYILISDVFNWKLNARMVVLSACETGLGQLSKGDDMVGLSRAFMQAGSDNLAATLWSVDDETTKTLMINFYKNVLDGKSPQEALRQAQLKIIREKRSHPFYWAPFVIYGKGK